MTPPAWYRNKPGNTPSVIKAWLSRGDEIFDEADCVVIKGGK